MRGCMTGAIALEKLSLALKFTENDFVCKALCELIIFD